MLDGDIKFWEPESTLPDGTNGGRKTSTTIVSGQVGNLVAPIADGDTVTGYVAGYKFYVGIDLPTQAIYYKPWLYISKPPVAANVGVCLIDTRDWFDRWDGAREKLERYLARGPKWPGRLLEKQLEGQRAIQIYQKLSVELPEVGAVYSLIANEALATEYEQFVRVTKVAQVTRVFTISGKDITFNVVTLDLSDALLYDFDGGAITDNDAYLPPAVLRTTLVANATMEYGIKPLTLERNIGDMTAQVASIFHQLVPSATQEVALTDVDAAGRATTLVAADNGTVSFTTSMPWAAGGALYLGTPCQPGTLSVVIGATTLTDDRAGQLKAGTTVVGLIDYAEGILTLASTAPTYNGSKTVSFKPAAAPALHVQSTSIGVDISNRGYVYALTLSPVPAPRTLKVAYRAQGRWYELIEQGDGALRGIDSAYGAGALSFVTGTVSVTLGALPDPDSEIVLTWGVPVWTFNRSAAAVEKPAFAFQLATPGAAPGTVDITWNDGTARSASDDGAGRLTGDATGEVDYAASKVTVRPNVLPPVGTIFAVDYDTGTAITYTAVSPLVDGSGNVNITLPDTGIVAGSLRAEWSVSWTDAVGQHTGGLVAVDDAAGVFRGFTGSALNYAAGTVTFKPGRTITVKTFTTTMVVEGSLTANQSVLMGIT